ncbi:putative ATP synthase 24 kDa subunit, mitochondrial [Silene latifolia]|uniref:putative ATP synthase 24 kDa subunit, mitochondrial n=1 Tax=Silene latifolia TaxID=37657 RepID=UPI003D76ACC4
MAFASRFLSKSKHLCYAQTVLPKDRVIAVRYFAKGAVPSPPAPPAPKALKGDEMLKGIFLEVKKKFETALSVFRQEKITIDPDDPAAVQRYADVMKMAREKAGLLSESQKIKNAIENRTQGIPDVRTYLLTLQEMRIKAGLPDDIGIEKMMFEALDTVEKEIKKPLMRDNTEGMARLTVEYDKGNKRLGISRKDLPKYEKKLDLTIARAQLENLKKDCVEAMEAQKKKEEFKDEEMPDVRSLDVRNFL